MYQGQSIGLWVDKPRITSGSSIAPTCSTRSRAAQQTRRPASAASRRRPILEFDPSGNLLRSWGGQDGPGYQWPDSNHGLNIDNKGNVWIGGNGGQDGHILKFTQDGKFVMQVGQEGRHARTAWRRTTSSRWPRRSSTRRRTKCSSPTATATAASRSSTPTPARSSGSGAPTASPPDDKASAAQGAYDPTVTYQHYRGPVHCAKVSVDGLVYVCDRTSNRIQVFKTDGTFVREIYTQRDSRGDGTTWDVEFSRDPQQRFLYVADGRNQKIRIFDRASMTELTSFGKGGHYPGEWYSLHNIATDSKGNLYTVETYQGRRLQRFLYKGLAPVTSQQTGVAYPTGGQ